MLRPREKIRFLLRVRCLSSLEPRQFLECLEDTPTGVNLTVVGVKPPRYLLVAAVEATSSFRAIATYFEVVPRVLEQAQARLDQANLDLQYTRVTAAQAGRVAKLSGAVGSFVTAGQSLMMFVPDEVWIVANYKETQLKYMRPGQHVEFTIDAYPDRKLTGHVASVQPGSGTAFSLLPAENATGNYVKVVQRVPVKIVVDHWPEDIPIGPGMSVVPWTKVR